MISMNANQVLHHVIKYVLILLVAIIVAAEAVMYLLQMVGHVRISTNAL